MAKPKILQQLNAEKASKILLASDPTQNMEAASKQYVDNNSKTTTTFTNAIQLSQAQTSITSSTRYYRPILVSTSEPTSNDGNIGDIWFVYEA